jgi:hypothetical protein
MIDGSTAGVCLASIVNLGACRLWQQSRVKSTRYARRVMPVTSHARLRALA